MLAALLAPLLLGVTGAPDTVLLDFSTDWCGHCRAMQPVIRQLETAGYPVRTVNADRERALAAQFHVSCFPCFVLVVDGREVQRIEGETDIGNLMAMFQRAGYDPSGRTSAAGGIARNGSSPAGSLASDAQAWDPAANGAGGAATVDGRERTFAQNSAPADNFAAAPAGAAAAGAAATGAPAGGQNGARSAVPASACPANEVEAAGGQTAASGNAAGGFALSDHQLIAACVRIKVADRTGNSYGSGTVIDVRNGEALILTCAHLFRDSDGKGDIQVDLFGHGEPQHVAGRLIGCDLSKDVGLVGIAAPASLEAIHVAPPGYTLHAGDRVATIGCSNAAPPTVQSSHVDSIGRFRGPANFQVAGQPVQGRSGGGVVSADGFVIGVCNAADPEDNEGLYAALPSVYKELDRAKLTFVYRPESAATAAGTGEPSAAVAAASPGATMPSITPVSAVAPAGREPNQSLADADRDPPAMPARMPGANPASGTVAATTEPGGAQPAGLTSDEAATQALMQQARGAEVICIVRPLSDPHARSEIIVLDKASPAFLKKLADERRDQGYDLPQLTSLEVPRGSR